MSIRTKIITTNKYFILYENEIYNTQCNINSKNISAMRIYLIKDMPQIIQGQQKTSTTQAQYFIDNKWDIDKCKLIFDYAYIDEYSSLQFLNLNQNIKIQYEHILETSSNWSILFEYDIDSEQQQIQLSITSIRIYIGNSHLSLKQNISNFSNLNKINKYWNITGIFDIQLSNTQFLNGIKIIQNDITEPIFIQSRQQFELFQNTRYILQYNLFLEYNIKNNNSLAIYIVKIQQTSHTNDDRCLLITNNNKYQNDKIQFMVSQSGKHKIIIQIQNNEITHIGSLQIYQNIENKQTQNTFNFYINTPYNINNSILDLKLQYLNQNNDPCQYDTNIKNLSIKGGNANLMGGVIINNGSSGGNIVMNTQRNVISNKYKVGNTQILRNRVLRIDNQNMTVKYASALDDNLVNVIGVSLQHKTSGQYINVVYNGIIKIQKQPVVTNVIIGQPFYLYSNGMITNIHPLENNNIESKYILQIGQCVNYISGSNLVYINYNPKKPIKIRD